MNDAARPSDLVPRDGAGLEYIQRIIRGEIPGVPIGVTLGFRVIEAERGRVVVLGRPDFRAYNLLGSVHGGWGAAILDTALALSVVSTLEADQVSTTVDIRINYLRPLTMETGEVRAEGRVLQVGRKLGYSEAKLMDSAGKLICHGTSSCLVMKRGAP